MSKVRLSLVILFFLFSFSGCEVQNTGKGIIEGKISIGPLCPVETDPPAPGCLPTAETYKAYPVIVYSSGGSPILLINPAPDGSFKIELEAGDYIIALNKALTGPGSSNLPLTFRVNQSEKTIINVDIDTGIR